MGRSGRRVPASPVSFRPKTMRYTVANPFGLDPKDRATLVSMRADGCGVLDVCREFGVCRATASLALRRIGRPGRPGPVPEPMTRAAVIARIRDGCRNGAEVAAALGYRSRGAVHRYVAELTRDGIVRKVGHGRYTQLVLTRKWDDPERNKEE